MVEGNLKNVKQGGWGVKAGTDYHIYWYVNVGGKWQAPSGKPKPCVGTVFFKDVGNKFLLHDPAPAWGKNIPDHFYGLYE